MLLPIFDPSICAQCLIPRTTKILTRRKQASRVAGSFRPIPSFFKQRQDSFQQKKLQKDLLDLFTALKNEDNLVVADEVLETCAMLLRIYELAEQIDAKIRELYDRYQKRENCA